MTMLTGFAVPDQVEPEEIAAKSTFAAKEKKSQAAYLSTLPEETLNRLISQSNIKKQNHQLQIDNSLYVLNGIDVNINE